MVVHPEAIVAGQRVPLAAMKRTARIVFVERIRFAAVRCGTRLARPRPYSPAVPYVTARTAWETAPEIVAVPMEPLGVHRGNVNSVFATWTPFVARMSGTSTAPYGRPLSVLIRVGALLFLEKGEKGPNLNPAIAVR